MIYCPFFNPLMLNGTVKCHGTVQAESAEDRSLQSHVSLKRTEIAPCISADQLASDAPGAYL